MKTTSSTHRLLGFTIPCAVLALLLSSAQAPADVYRFNDASDTDWMNGENWQNQTAGIKGWQVGGIPLPGANDIARFNYAGSPGSLAADAGTIDGLQIGVDESGHLTLNSGAVLTTDSGSWSGMGAGGASSGSLTIDGGLLTVNNGWNMGWNDGAHTVSLTINGGEMRVASAFSQVRTTTTATTTLNGGLLDVDRMTLNAGVVDIAGGTLVIRSGDKRSNVSAWVDAGFMIASGGGAGAGVEAVYSDGWTVVTAGLVPMVNTPDVSGRKYAKARDNLDAAGLSVGLITLAFDLPGDPVPGTVCVQSPGAGTEVAVGSEVNLVIVAPDLPPPRDGPQLSILHLGGNDYGLFWPKGYGFYLPKTTDDLSGTRPWTAVNGPVIKDPNADGMIVTAADTAAFYRLYLASVDNTSLDHKSMMGYQGWFSAPGDGTAVTDRWHHWATGKTGYPDVGVWGIDFYPDMSEYSAHELYATGWTLNNGDPAYLFSSAHPLTVERHCRWMWENEIDGVFLQRFLNEVQDPRFFSFRNAVAENIRAGCETYGRLFAIMYDVSGVTDATMLTKMTDDWNHLVSALDITNSPSYAHHNGKPVVSIWGLGFSGRGLTPATAQAIIDYFKEQQGMTVMGGVPSSWRTLNGDSETDPAWGPVYRSFDIISPWTVGRYNDLTGADSWRVNKILPDLAEASAAGADYMPVIFPGFSWHNIHGGQLNQIPRRGGEFYWRQAYNAQRSGCTMLYTAMFDEMDEGTAMLKMAPSTDELPAGATMVPLDVDGISLPSDWYLRVGGEAAKMLHGKLPLQGSLPISP